MNESSFHSRDGHFMWNDEDFFRIRENKQKVPQQLVDEAVKFYQSAPAKTMEECQVVGFRPRFRNGCTQEELDSISVQI